MGVILEVAAAMTSRMQHIVPDLVMRSSELQCSAASVELLLAFETVFPLIGTSILAPARSLAYGAQDLELWHSDSPSWLLCVCGLGDMKEQQCRTTT